jgi:hypothetical protein
MRKSRMARDSSTPDTGTSSQYRSISKDRSNWNVPTNAELQEEANRLNALMKPETHNFWRQKSLPKCSQKQRAMLQPIQLNQVILHAIWPFWVVIFIDAPPDSLFNGSCTWVRPPRRGTRQRRHQECHVMQKQNQIPSPLCTGQIRLISKLGDSQRQRNLTSLPTSCTRPSG